VNVSRSKCVQSQTPELLNGSCGECGQQTRTYLDINDDMHYCHECWVAFYGRPPTAAASSPSMTSHCSKVREQRQPQQQQPWHRQKPPYSAGFETARQCLGNMGPRERLVASAGHSVWDLQPLEHLQKMNQEEFHQLPRLVRSFQRWMEVGPSKKSARSYATTLARLAHAHRRSLAAMRDRRYFEFVKTSRENRMGNSKMSSVLKKFLWFLAQSRAVGRPAGTQTSQ